MSACRSCGQDVVWAETVPGGKKVPLDPRIVEPTERGALVLVNGYAYSHAELVERIAVKQAVSTVRAADLIRSRYDAHPSHFSTCPHADRHRKDRR